MNSPFGLVEKFKQLRHKTRTQLEIDEKERRKNQPIPTSEECRIGRFREGLEPQVRDTVFSLNTKGYLTEQSGFTPSDPSIQFLTIDIGRNLVLKRDLERLGVIVKEWPYRCGTGKRINFVLLEFHPAHPDLEEIERTWKLIDAIFPDTGTPAPKNDHPLARFFRIRYARREYPFELAELERDAELYDDAARVLRRIYELK